MPLSQPRQILADLPQPLGRFRLLRCPGRVLGLHVDDVLFDAVIPVGDEAFDVRGRVLDEATSESEDVHL